MRVHKIAYCNGCRYASITAKPSLRALNASIMAFRQAETCHTVRSILRPSIHTGRSQYEADSCSRARISYGRKSRTGRCTSLGLAVAPAERSHTVPWSIVHHLVLPLAVSPNTLLPGGQPTCHMSADPSKSLSLGEFQVLCFT